MYINYNLGFINKFTIQTYSIHNNVFKIIKLKSNMLSKISRNKK